MREIAMYGGFVAFHCLLLAAVTHNVIARHRRAAAQDQGEGNGR